MVRETVRAAACDSGTLVAEINDRNPLSQLAISLFKVVKDQTAIPTATTASGKARVRPRGSGEPEPAHTRWQDADHVKRVVRQGTGLIILENKDNSAVIDKDIPHDPCGILPFHNVDLGTTARHATCKVATEK